MSDLLRQASAWLENQRTQFASIPVLYRRGEQELEVLATIGRTTFDLDDGAGAVLRVESRDYLILASDLSMGFPQRGDRIVEIEDGAALVYEVMPFGNEPHWRWSDPYRQTLRIHTKQVDVETTP